MSDVSQALQHGAPSEANKNKIVVKKKTFNNCIRKLASRKHKIGSLKLVRRDIGSRVASKDSSKDSSVSQGLKNYCNESSTRYIASNSVLQTSSAVSKILTGLNENQNDIQAHNNLSLNGRSRNQRENPSDVGRPQIVDASQKMRMRLQQLEKSKECQLRANIGFRPVYHSSSIDMMKDDSVYVSKNVSFKNNLDIEMEKMRPTISLRHIVKPIKF